MNLETNCKLLKCNLGEVEGGGRKRQKYIFFFKLTTSANWGLKISSLQQICFQKHKLFPEHSHIQCAGEHSNCMFTRVF